MDTKERMCCHLYIAVSTNKTCILDTDTNTYPKSVYKDLNTDTNTAL